MITNDYILQEDLDNIAKELKRSRLEKDGDIHKNREIWLRL